MDLYMRLMDDYGYNNPIILKELDYPELTKPALRLRLKRLVDNNQLERYIDGVYYIPKITRLGKSTITAEDVIRGKYIGLHDDTYGYYTGIKLMNDLGLTTQIPNKYEVISNKVNTKDNVVEIGKFIVNVKKSRIQITNENVNILKLIELLKYNQFLSLSFDEKKKLIDSIGINKKDIPILNNIVSNLPASVSKKLIESEVIYAIAS